MPRIHLITSRQLMKRPWLPALLLVLATQTLAAGLDWSPYPEDKDKDAQKAKAAEVRAKTAEQRAAELERRLKAAEEKAAKTIPPVTPPRPGIGAPSATPSIATTAPAVLAPLSVFRDKLKGGGEGPAMVVIPAGDFNMGSFDIDASSDEKPVHRVSIKQPFAIGRTEVTQKEWRQVMGSDQVQSRFKGCDDSGCTVVIERSDSAQRCDDCPVEGVSWNGAQSYIKKLNEQTGKTTYRLPSEAEWEYACRGGKANEEYCGGNDVGAVAWFSLNSGDKIHPVAQKKANAYGLHDMSGNVMEWVDGWYHHSYASAPQDGSAEVSGGAQKYRVLRGGYWDRLPREVRSASRDNDQFRPPANPNFGIGFRVARTLP